MIEGLPFTWFDGGAYALLTLFFVLVFTGRLKPKADVDDARKDRDAWQAQAQAAIKELAIVTRAVEKQADAKELSVALLQSVRKEGEK